MIILEKMQAADWQFVKQIYEDCSFRIIGKRERIGKMNGIWRDTILLERRSNKVGV